jgi:hypothetical protein
LFFDLPAEMGGQEFSHRVHRERREALQTGAACAVLLLAPYDAVASFPPQNKKLKSDLSLLM